MFPVTETPEHVLEAVWRIEKNEEQTFAEPVKFEPHHFFALFKDKLALRPECVLIEAPIVVAGVTFGHSQGRKWTNTLRDFLCVIAGRGNRKQRCSRVKVHRRCIKFQMW